MDLLDFFRKGADAGWVCKRAARLTLDGRIVRLRPGQAIYTGDFRYQGTDLAVTLEMLLGSLEVWDDERPQSISEAMTT